MVTRRTALATGLSAAALGAAGYAFWPRLDAYNAELERQRQLLSGDPQMRDFIGMATLAANGHNTQPWKFRVDDARVDILPDLSRRTEVVDPDDHHLYASLGCAAENLVLAAGAHGRLADVSVNSGPQSHIEVAFQNGPPAGRALYQAIPLRQSTRTQYDGQPVSPRDIDQLQEAAKQDGVSVLFFTDQDAREAILEYVVAGNSAQLDDPAFVDELQRWIRFSSNQAIEKGDGLFSACSGNPVTPEWLGKRMFRSFFTKQAENDKYHDHIRSSAGIAVFVGARADPKHWIAVGRSFERFALQATALGIRNAHINQPIEVPAIRSEFANWLGMPDARPDLVVRFGRAPMTPMSLRRPVDQVLV